MRTACLVIVTFVLAVAFKGYPQQPGEGVDREITVTGQDESALPVPPPELPDPPRVPDLDLQRPTPPARAPVQPPSGLWAAPAQEWHLTDPLVLYRKAGVQEHPHGS